MDEVNEIQQDLLEERPEQKFERVSLTPYQSLGMQLMSARDLIQKKNGQLAALQSQYSRTAAADAARIAELEQQVAGLTRQLITLWNQTEAGENQALSRKLALPAGVHFQFDENGECFYMQQVTGETP